MSETEFTSPHLYVIALVSGIMGILMVRYYYPLTALAVILVWPAFISGANAVRQVARYGLGTGTSSIGYWGTAVGTTMAFTSRFINPVYGLYSGILGALIVGAVTGIAAQKIIRMKIPVMIRDSAILASSTAIMATFFLCVLRGDRDAYLIYPLIYIAITLAILHPFNGSMGAGENQRRTLRLSAVEAGMTTGLFGLVVTLYSDTLTGLSIMIVSAVGFLVFLRRWFSAVKQDTYESTWTGYSSAEH